MRQTAIRRIWFLGVHCLSAQPPIDMRTLTPFKWKGAAAVCFAAALVLDFVAKQFAVAAATGATPVERQPNAVASDMFAGIGLGVACVGGLLWIASYLRHEG